MVKVDPSSRQNRLRHRHQSFTFNCVANT